MTDDHYHLPDLKAFIDSYPGTLIIAAAILLVLFFPIVAATVAPDGRRWQFFVLTLFVLPGPLGVACASIAQARD